MMSVNGGESIRMAMPWDDMLRIDVLKLKECIVRRVGAQKARIYFLYFLRFLSSRLSKLELDKLVVVIIGRENVALHNQLVKAILANAVKGKLPPPLRRTQPKSKFTRKSHSPSLTSNHSICHTSPSTLSNGDSLLSSPHSGRSAVHHSHDRGLRASPFGPCEAHSAPAFSRPFGQLPGGAPHLGNESKALGGSADATYSEALRDDDSFSLKEDKKELLPPLVFGSCIRRLQGLPADLWSTGTGSKGPVLHAYPAQLLHHGASNDDYSSVIHLPEEDIMHGQIEEIAIREGLQGASRECANVLDHALDAYLTKLIKAGGSVVCAKVKEKREQYAQYGFLSAKSVDSTARVNVKLQQDMNGLCMAMPVQSVNAHAKSSCSSISLVDFKVAMDMEPDQLGENWPLQSEKISARIFYQ